METKKRKEVIQVSGTVILIVMTLVANLLVVGFVYRWHQWQVFAAEKKHNIGYKKLLDSERAIKNEIVRLEGATSWAQTAYMHPIRKGETESE